MSACKRPPACPAPAPPVRFAVWVLPPPEPVLDPYNNSLVMPLHEWVEHPIAEELLHNGATLQARGRWGGRALSSCWLLHGSAAACPAGAAAGPCSAAGCKLHAQPPRGPPLSS